MKTISKQTEDFISDHPSIRDCLKKGVINYSRLARLIAKELKIEKSTNMEAILVACRRYVSKLKGINTQEDKILKVYKGSSLELKTKIVTVIIDKRIYSDNLISIEKKIRQKADTFYAIEGTSVFIIITSENYLDEIKHIFGRKVKKTTKNLAMITIKSAQDLEEIPGVMAQLFSLFGERGINIVECMSCWTDTIIVVEDKDLQKAITFLNF